MDVEKLAKLTRLKKEDILSNKKELYLILDAFKQIEEVDTKGIEPTSTPIEVLDKYREDIIVDMPDRDGFFENAPQLAGRSFKVPFKL